MLKYILGVIIITSCSQYNNVYEMKPASENINAGKIYEFENDEVKIDYAFWNNGGRLIFTFYNKLNVPLYIDWKKSSLVRNGVKSDYWIDEIKTKSKNSGYGLSSLYSGSLNYLNFSSWNSVTETNSIKPERITFLAPKSSITRVFNNLYNLSDLKLKNATGNEQIATQFENTFIPAPYVTYSNKNTPFTFRNFLTISTTEKFDKESYIDNEFYVSKIYRVNRKYFDVILSTGKKKFENTKILPDARRFYIEM